jgi:hypothetical protein
MLSRASLTKHEHYTQRVRVAGLFGYRLWTADFLPQLRKQATQTVRRDVTPGFVAAELIVWLGEHKIIRPGYTTLQELVSETLSAERRRLSGLLAERIRRHLRPLYVALDFAGIDPNSPWLAALAWAKSVFAKQQRLSQRPLVECPAATLPKRLRPYLLTYDAACGRRIRQTHP